MQDLQERLSTNMAQVCAQIPPGTRMLFVHGGRDKSVPVHNAQQYAAVLPQARSRSWKKLGIYLMQTKIGRCCLSTVCSFVSCMQPSPCKNRP